MLLCDSVAVCKTLLVAEALTGSSTVLLGGYGAGGGGGLNKRKGMRPGDMGGNEDYMGSGRFGGPLDREMQFFEKVVAPTAADIPESIASTRVQQAWGGWNMLP